MFLIYMDESGKPNYGDPENYVLSALTIHETNWQAIDNQVKQLKIKHFPAINPDQIEIHAKEIVSGQNIFKNLRWEQRMALFSDACQLVGNIDCTIISVLIDKARRYNNNFDCEAWCMQLLFERLCKYLDKVNEERVQSSKPSESAILLIDSIDPNYDKKVRARLLPWIRDGTTYCPNHSIIEDPIFVNSSYRNLSQLVDCVAYCVRRKHKVADKKIDAVVNDCYEMIYPKFDKSKDGQVINFGLKIFP